MKLNRNFFQKVYNVLIWYGTPEEKELPNSLCPLFWKIVLDIIVFIPISIAVISGKIVDKVVNFIIPRRVLENIEFFNVPVVVLYILSAVSSIGTIITLFFYLDYFKTLDKLLGTLLLSITMLFVMIHGVFLIFFSFYGLLYLALKIASYFKPSILDEVDTDEIFVEQGKDFGNFVLGKICPKIDWYE